MGQWRFVHEIVAARTYVDTHQLAKRASNYRRDRRVIRALMSADGGLLAARTKKRSDDRKRERKRSSMRARAKVMLRTNEEHDNERDEEGQIKYGRRRYPEGSNIGLRWRVKGKKKASRCPCGEGKYGCTTVAHRQIYGAATSFSRRDGLDLTRSCLNAVRWFPCAAAARRRLPGSEERPICTADLWAELLTRTAFREPHSRKPSLGLVYRIINYACSAKWLARALARCMRFSCQRTITTTSHSASEMIDHRRWSPVLLR